jgi:dipeptidyl aminopeptidase/acylaminoacyl peptidase
MDCAAGGFQRMPGVKVTHRFAGLSYFENGETALVRDYDRERRWSRTMIGPMDKEATSLPVLFERNVNDRYGDPGTPATKRLANGESVLREVNGKLVLAGAGAGPKGERPFLDLYDLKTGKTERIFECKEGEYETATVLNDDATLLLVRRESPTNPGNYVLQNRLTVRDGPKETPLTNFQDPMPLVRKVKKQLVTTKRSDGVTISFTLYLPPDYKEGTKLPAFMWAYPREFNDAGTAGQVSGSPYRFTTIAGTSPLFFALQGYAVLDEVGMPIVGPPETANDTFLPQLADNAKAAIDKADEMGVIDRNRVGVGGHSYGAFMTANLLAHTKLFKAGIARSGAYNRTLTPFGFQNERRTFWEAPQVYGTMSPFYHADKIKTPLLLIHGEADNNPGTFPMQSERLYQAVRGNGGTVRLVLLPHESHGYAARESIEHTLAESLDWLDKHVKNAK